MFLSDTMEEVKKENVNNPLLNEVRAEREKLEKARDEARKEADRLEQLKSDQMLSGVAGVRTEPLMMTPQEQAKKEAKEFWKGSAIEDAIDKYNG